MTTIDKIAWIHLENGKLLCARSKGKSIYYIPGGKREPGESDEQTLVREIEEELSVRIKPVTITHYGTFEAQADGKAEGVRVKISCFTGQYEGTINPASEIEELAWLGYGDIDRVSEASRLI
ncbi:NUDIX domain-containing protein, partial [Paenibacillus thailandensis]